MLQPTAGRPHRYETTDIMRHIERINEFAVDIITAVSVITYLHVLCVDAYKRLFGKKKKLSNHYNSTVIRIRIYYLLPV